MSDTLLPCPFCGGKAELVKADDRDRYIHVVRCPRCEATSGGSSFQNDAWNTEQWNRRPSPWLDITLAPKDGTYIDLWGAGGRYPDCYWDENGNAFIDDHGFYYHNPTHFAYIPAGPEK